MFYSYEEFEGRDMATDSEKFPMDQVSHPCEDNQETSEINHERIPYFETESTFEGKEELGGGCSPRDGIDGEDLLI